MNNEQKNKLREMVNDYGSGYSFDDIAKFVDNLIFQEKIKALHEASQNSSDLND